MRPFLLNAAVLTTKCGRFLQNAADFARCGLSYDGMRPILQNAALYTTKYDRFRKMRPFKEKMRPLCEKIWLRPKIFHFGPKMAKIATLHEGPLKRKKAQILL